MTAGWQVGIDIGGTFTDLIAFHPETREFRTAKVESVADDPLISLLSALAAVDVPWEAADDVVQGTTLVTNAIVEDRLAPVALVTTHGFADTLDIGRQNRRHLYRLDLPPKSVSLVPPERRFEVRERLDAEGNVLLELESRCLKDVAAKTATSGAEAVAVTLLHSYANPAHERRLGEELRAVIPYVALSHQVNPEAREYERTATTVLSAAVMPLVNRYVERLEEEKPPGGRLHLFHSAGAMASLEAARDLPLGLALSGPAAGSAAAGRLAEELGIESALSFDMGGTTTDVCLIVGGRADVRSDRHLADRPLRQPAVAVESIGAGTGSIARFDTGALLLGPESAGAEPGPACYGRGGVRPTVCDADLVLGYLDPERTLGHRVRLDPEAAAGALAPLAAEVGVEIPEVALGVGRVATAAMARALHRVTVERGIDGRRCVLLAFGGAGPMHAVELARVFGIRRVVVPRFSSLFSALGCLSAELSYSQQQTLRMASTAWDAGRLAEARAALLAHLAAPIKAAGHEAELRVEEVAAVRYSGQSYAVEVPDPCLDDPGRLGREFRRLHEIHFGFATDEPWELTALRLRVSVPRRSRPDGATPNARRPSAPTKTLPCWFNAHEPVPTPRYDRGGLAQRQAINGPAVVEDEWSTVVVPPGASLTAEATGHLHIDVGEAA